jgi:hypothetical protein
MQCPHKRPHELGCAQASNACSRREKEEEREEENEVDAGTHGKNGNELSSRG